MRIAAFGAGTKGGSLSPAWALNAVFTTSIACAGIQVGQSVAEMVYGAYCDWGITKPGWVLAVQTCAPEIVALLTSGLTASIGKASLCL